MVLGRMVSAILNGKKKDDDLAVRAQQIIDSYALQIRRSRKTVGFIDVALWSLVALSVALTLFLYIYLR